MLTALSAAKIPKWLAARSSGTLAALRQITPPDVTSFDVTFHLDMMRN